MLKTIPKKIPDEIMKILKDPKIIKILHDEFQLAGRISEETFDELGIPLDVNLRGEIESELRRSNFISRQRCQTLNTELHVENIKQQKIAVLETKKDKYDKIVEKTDNFIKACAQAEGKVSSIMMNNPSYIEKYTDETLNVKFKITSAKTIPIFDIKHSPVNVFKHMNVGELEGFVAAKVAKNNADIKSYHKSINLKKWPNKGTVDDAINDRNCLIKMAHDCRMKPNIMTIPSFNDVFPNCNLNHVAKPIVLESFIFENRSQCAKKEV